MLFSMQWWSKSKCIPQDPACTLWRPGLAPRAMCDTPWSRVIASFLRTLLRLLLYESPLVTYLPHNVTQSQVEYLVGRIKSSEEYNIYGCRGLWTEQKAPRGPKTPKKYTFKCVKTNIWVAFVWFSCCRVSCQCKYSPPNYIFLPCDVKWILLSSHF